MSAPIAAAFRAEVQQLRAMGFTCPEIAILTGKSKGAMGRAAKPYVPPAPRPPHMARAGERQSKPGDLVLADLSGATYPLRTLVGMLLRAPVKPPKRVSTPNAPDVCYRCLYLRECHQAVMRGDPVSCEKPLQKELLCAMPVQLPSI